MVLEKDGSKSPSPSDDCVSKSSVNHHLRSRSVIPVQNNNCNINSNSNPSVTLPSRPILGINKFSTINYVSTSPTRVEIAKHDNDKCNVIKREFPAKKLVKKDDKSLKKPAKDKQFAINNCITSGKSYLEKSSLVGFFKFMQHQCTLKKKDHAKPIVILHEKINKSICQLKCDLDNITELHKQSNGPLVVNKNNESPEQVLARMACNLSELEDKLMKADVPTCGEILERRKMMIDLIKNIQKSIGCFLECEMASMQERQIQICNFLRSLKCIENEFRCMTAKLRTHCCGKSNRKAIEVDKSKDQGSNSVKTKGLHCDKPSQPDNNCKLTPTQPNYSVCKKNENNKCKSNVESSVAANCETKPPSTSPCGENPCAEITQCILDTLMKKNEIKTYDITGIDVVYTKSTIHSYKQGDGGDTANNEECIDDQISCHIPVKDSVGGEPVCEIKVRNGKEDGPIQDTKVMKEKLCRLSNVWFESAKQLIDAFNENQNSK